MAIPATAITAKPPTVTLSAAPVYLAGMAPVEVALPPTAPTTDEAADEVGTAATTLLPDAVAVRAPVTLAAEDEPTPPHTPEAEDETLETLLVLEPLPAPQVWLEDPVLLELAVEADFVEVVKLAVVEADLVALEVVAGLVQPGPVGVTVTVLGMQRPSPVPAVEAGPQEVVTVV